VEPGCVKPTGPLNRRDPDHAIRRGIDKHEHVTRVGARRGSRERSKRTVDARGQALAVGRQRGEPVPGALGKREYGGKVVPRDWPDEKHRRYVSARSSALSSRAKPSRISSRLMTSDGAMRMTSGPATS